MGEHRDDTTLQRFFAWLATRRARAICVVCCDMRRLSQAALRQAVPPATGLFDRFHLTRHAADALDAVRRQTWRRLAEPHTATFKRTRFRRLTNPENLSRQKWSRLAGLLRLNAPIVKPYLLKEALRRCRASRSSARAAGRLRKWLWRASQSRRAPFAQRPQTLRTRVDGLLARPTRRGTIGAPEGMNNKVRRSVIGRSATERRGPIARTSPPAVRSPRSSDTLGR